jgi:hypothetical protein
MRHYQLIDFQCRLRGPFAGLFIRFGRRGSFILKPTRNELFSERHGYKKNHRFAGWSWRWQPMEPHP